MGMANFGRWGGAVPTTTTNWQVFNFQASSIEVPWDSMGLPNFTNIVQFKNLPLRPRRPQIRQTRLPPPSILMNLQVRNTPLIEFPPPSPMRAKIDDFEGYADSTALLGAYHYVNGGTYGHHRLA
jgi:hypothetical protein